MQARLPVLAGDAGLQGYLKAVYRFPVLDKVEERQLARAWREEGNEKAAHVLVTSHLRLVAKIAMGMRGYGLPVSDLIGEGTLGLLQAVKRFDPYRGARLSTYAAWWIKAAINEFVLRSWSLVRIGTTAAQKKLFFGLRKAKAQIAAVDDAALQPQEVEEIAGAMNVRPDDVSAMDARLLGPDKSLNAPFRIDEEGEWLDALADERASQEDVLIERDERESRRKALVESLAVLNERERRILTARRLSEPKVRLQDLAAEFGISPERVRQIELAAFEKLKAVMAEKEGDSGT